MKKVLDELITLDQRAKEIIRPAENELANLEVTIKSKSLEILDEADKTLNAKIDQMRAIGKAKVTEQKVEIDKEASSRLARLEEEWDENAQKWKEEILSKIVNHPPQGMG